MGTRLMVSVWPSVNPVSSNWAELRERGLLIGTEFGLAANTAWTDKPSDTPAPVAFYDATHPEARQFIWDTVEPQLRPATASTSSGWMPASPRSSPCSRPTCGSGRAAVPRSPIFTRASTRARSGKGGSRAGQADGLSFVRSAWAGSQRYGAVLWSGDIGTDFATLRRQIAAGLSTGISGIPWWCADIGGFHGGDPGDPAYREVMIRWFQFGALSPIFRMHGDRAPRTPLGRGITGGPNEVWSYGAEAEAIMVAYLHLRERLRPYIQQQMAAAADSGLPPMRALFLEFPDDAHAWTIADQYLFGPDLLVAPVLEPAATKRTVYLPAGAAWTDAWTGHDYAGRRRGHRCPLRSSASRCCCAMTPGCRSPRRFQTGREPRREQRSATRVRRGMRRGCPSYDRYASLLLRSIAVRTRKGTTVTGMAVATHRV